MFTLRMTKMSLYYIIYIILLAVHIHRRINPAWSKIDKRESHYGSDTLTKNYMLKRGRKIRKNN